jgi:hypothetical protein
MTTRTDFDPEEWQTVVGAPAIAGIIVSAAERGDTTREATAIAQAYGEAQKAHPGFDLLGEIVARSPEGLPSEPSVHEGAEGDGLKQIQTAVALLEAKATPEEVDTYRRFAFEVAERVALAARSGDVLGIGGKLVSDAEQEALERVAEALGLPPDAGV